MGNLVLERYEIVKCLGSGGFGDTFLAKDIQMPSQRLVVVKQLKPANASNNTSNELIKKLFEKEASVLEDLGSHNSQIPKLYSYFSDNDQFYLVQEYIQGKSLNTIIPIGSEQAKSILSSLLTTLKYIHNQGIIHRDIKPENIILRDADRLPVLIDFGAVKETMGTVNLSSGSTVSSVIIGTRGFMAPEQSVGRSVFSTDLYALGLTIIYALTKKLPVEFETSQLTGELDWQSHVPDINKDLAEILDKAIQMEPSRRYPTAEAMYQDLHSLISFGTMPVFPPPPPPLSSPPLSPSPQGNKILIALGLVCFLAFLGLGSGFMFMQQINHQAILKTIEAEKEKQQAELKRIEAENKIIQETKHQQVLEQQRLDEERQKLVAETNKTRYESQLLKKSKKDSGFLSNTNKKLVQYSAIAKGISSWGWADGYSTMEKARSAAIKDCQSRGEDTCPVSTAERDYWYFVGGYCDDTPYTAASKHDWSIASDILRSRGRKDGNLNCYVEVKK